MFIFAGIRTTTAGYIAAIAMTNGFIVATYDAVPFKEAGADVINVWET